jgi:hypothetical protein
VKIKEAPKICGPPLPPTSTTSSPVTADKSVHTNSGYLGDLLDDNGTVTIARMLGARRKLQSHTSTHSERTVELNPKFALRKVTDDAGKVPKMTHQEASQRVRVAQIHAGLLEKEKKYREVRWKTANKALRDALTSQGVSICLCSYPLLLADLVMVVFKSYQISQQDMSMH